MAVNVKTILKSPLAVGACITAIVTIAGALYAVANPKPSVQGSKSPMVTQVSTEGCKIVVFDDKPPLNVRATPMSKSGNIVGALQNGDVVTVIDAKDGWLQISAPIVGWIYENLTQRICGQDAPTATLLQDKPSSLSSAGLPNDSGSRLYLKSIAYFQAGNLVDAIALAKAVPANSAAYSQAQTALKTMPRTWNQAKAQYSTARAAEQQSRWSDVLKIATTYPDIRYWREKLTPIVKRASQMQHDLASGKQN